MTLRTFSKHYLYDAGKIGEFGKEKLGNSK